MSVKSEQTVGGAALGRENSMDYNDDLVYHCPQRIIPARVVSWKIHAKSKINVS